MCCKVRKLNCSILFLGQLILNSKYLASYLVVPKVEMLVRLTLFI
jgi:hypothetical protein